MQGLIWCKRAEGHLLHAHMDEGSRIRMEGRAIVVVRASNIQEESHRDVLYVEVAHENTSGGACVCV